MTLKQRFYKKHVFICTNMKENELKCCGATSQSKEVFTALKKHVANCQKNGENNTRVSRAGCLGRCSEEPVAVIYPEGSWFNLTCAEDVRALFEKSCED